MNRFELIDYRGTTVPKSKEPPSFLVSKPSDRDIMTRLVKQDEAGKPELLAYRIYGDSRMYWILVSFNSIHYGDAVATGVMGWPRVGQTIYHPTRQVAFSA